MDRALSRGPSDSQRRHGLLERLGQGPEVVRAHLLSVLLPGPLRHADAFDHLYPLSYGIHVPVDDLAAAGNVSSRFSRRHGFESRSLVAKAFFFFKRESAYCALVFASEPGAN